MLYTCGSSKCAFKTMLLNFTPKKRLLPSLAELFVGTYQAISQLWQGRSTPYIGDTLVPPLRGKPCNGYINPYYKVDDHPLP